MGPDTCPVCGMLAEAERTAVADAIVATADPDRAPTLCLPHLCLAVATDGPAEGIRTLLDGLAAALRRRSEDMRSYALKREAHHGELLTDEETGAHLEALELLAGRASLVPSWRREPMTSQDRIDPPGLLIVLRHAKSAWPEGVPDHERPLAGRGRRDAPQAGIWLRDTGRVPDSVSCSTARRARETWRLASGQLYRPRPPTDHDDRLYAASADDLLRVVAETRDDVTTLLLVGHDPGIQELTLHLTGAAVGDALARTTAKFPTSAIAVLAVPRPWHRIRPGSGLLIDFVVPRG